MGVWRVPHSRLIAVADTPQIALAAKIVCVRACVSVRARARACARARARARERARARVYI